MTDNFDMANSPPRVWYLIVHVGLRCPYKMTSRLLVRRSISTMRALYNYTLYAKANPTCVSCTV